MKQRHGSIEARGNRRDSGMLAACLIAAASTLAPATSNRDREPPRFEIHWHADGVYAAPNPVHAFRVLFRESGLTILDESSEDAGAAGFELELGLREYASASTSAPVGSAVLSACGERIDYRRSAPLGESYLNGRRGLELELELASAPDGARIDGTVRLGFGLSGNLSPRVLAGSQLVDLVDWEGRQPLRLAGLRATDGLGNEIPARFELGISAETDPGGEPTAGLSIVADITGALFPISVRASIASPRGLGGDHLVISEIQIDGDGPDATRDEFIEVYNPTSSPVSLAGWSLQHRKNSNFSQDNIASGSVPAHGFFLAAKSGYNGSTPPDFLLVNMDNLQGGGTIFLVNDQFPLSGCPAGGSVVDKVGWTGAACTEASAAPSPVTNGSIERRPGGQSSLCGNGFDTDDNAQNFQNRPTSQPQNSASPAEACCDLSVSQTDSPEPVALGGTLTYGATVTNAGPSSADDVIALASLPASATFLSTSGCDNDPGGVPSCELGAIDALGGSRAYTVSVTVDGCPESPIHSSVTVSSSTTDPFPGNNSDTEDTAVTGTDPPPEVGATLVGAPASTFTWSAVAGATSYPVYRGTVTQPWSYNHACLENSADTTVADAISSSTGVALYYLVAARNVCGDSGLGSGTAGPRPNSSPCP